MKSGSARLNHYEHSLKNAIENKRVRWPEYHVPTPLTHTPTPQSHPRSNQRPSDEQQKPRQGRAASTRIAQYRAATAKQRLADTIVGSALQAFCRLAVGAARCRRRYLPTITSDDLMMVVTLSTPRSGYAFLPTL